MMVIVIIIIIIIIIMVTHLQRLVMYLMCYNSETKCLL